MLHFILQHKGHRGMNNHTILLVEDTAELSAFYAKILGGCGYDVIITKNGKEFLDGLKTAAFQPDLLIIDIKLPDIDGRDVLTHLKQSGFCAPIIMMTGQATINMAVEAMQTGATDFLIKPFSPDKLITSVSRALKQSISPVNRHTQKIKPKPTSFEQTFIGTSMVMQNIYKTIQNAAKSDAPVFITGESGTGKELCARALHRLSPRASKPFIAINCAAIPHDLLESEFFGHVKGSFTGSIATRDGAISRAQSGTLFLDEIAEMSPDMQVKLLRFLQDLKYQKIGSDKLEKADVRIVCATNKSPKEEIKAGRLRDDLYYRLHVVGIHMPPLRNRPNDILDLGIYFLMLYSREENKSFKGFTKQVQDILLSHPWDGNVRELQNIIRGIVVLHDAPLVTCDMLPPFLSNTANAQSNTFAKITPETSHTLISPLWRVEQNAIEAAIDQCDGNIPRAAALLEVSPSTLYRKIQTWDKQNDGHNHIL